MMRSRASKIATGPGAPARQAMSRSRALRLFGLGALVLGLQFGCSPTNRVTQEIRVGISSVRLTNGAPLRVENVHLDDDPYWAEHGDEFDTIETFRVEVKVPQNTSSRLKIGVYVSKTLETRLSEAVKIADFNLEALAVTPAEGTEVRVFNQQLLLETLLERDFFFYVRGEADRLDATVAEVNLVIDARFIQ